MNNADTTADSMLHAYIDGELARGDEARFFAMLADDEDYRARLRDIKAIRLEALAGAALGAAPAESASALFARLDFAPIPPPRHGVILPLLSAAWTPIASAAAAAFITAVIILGLRDTDVRNGDMQLAARQESASERVQQAPPTKEDASDDALRSSRAVTAPRTKRVIAVPPGATGVAVPGDERHTEGALAMNTEAPGGEAGTRDGAHEHSVPTTDIVKLADNGTAHVPASADPATLPSLPTREGVAVYREGLPATTVEQHTRAQSGLPLYGGDTRGYQPSWRQSAADQGISVEVRGITAASFPDPTIASRSTPWMENMAIAAYYGGERHDIGVEFGQEAFSQHYGGVEQGKYVRYEQNLLTSWLLAGWRYRFRPLIALGGIEPYAGLGAGATFEGWPLLRGGVGIMYMPDQRVRFHLGLDGTIMTFPYQGRWFTSKRAGTTYGISVLF